MKIKKLDPADSPMAKILEGKKPVHIPELEFEDEELTPITKEEASWLLRFSIVLARKLGWIPEDEDTEGP